MNNYRLSGFYASGDIPTRVEHFCQALGGHFMQVSNQSQAHRTGLTKQKQGTKPKQNDNQQPPSPFQKGQPMQNTPSLNSRLSVTA